MSSVVEIPEELNVMVPALQELVESAKAQVERGRLGGAVDYGSFERSLCEKLNEVERRAHEAALTALDINALTVVVGGRRYTRVLEDVGATFMSQAGGVPVSRTLYRPSGERNGPTLDLVALRAGAVGGKWLPTTAQEMAFDVQQLTSREAEINGSPAPARRGSTISPPRSTSTSRWGSDSSPPVDPGCGTRWRPWMPPGSTTS